MKKFWGLFGVLSIVGCLFGGKVDVYAADEEIIELPVEEYQIVHPSGETDINVMSTAALSACNLRIGIASNGVSVTFTTTSTVNASEIGVKNVVLQEKNGTGWRDIPISNHSAKGTTVYSGGVVYTGAQKGKTYRVYCTHYAIIDGKEYTLYDTTGNLVYN